MSITQLRRDIDRKLDEMEQPMLEALHTLLYVQPLTKDESDIVGYNSSGEPITKVEFAQQADRIVKEVRAGEYVTLEESRERTKAWLESTK